MSCKDYIEQEVLEHLPVDIEDMIE